MRTSPKGPDKLNELVIKGLLEENKELFIKRLGAILDNASLWQLVNGITLNVTLRSNEEAIAALKAKFPELADKTIEIKEADTNYEGKPIIRYIVDGEATYSYLPEGAGDVEWL